MLLLFPKKKKKKKQQQQPNVGGTKHFVLFYNLINGRGDTPNSECGRYTAKWVSGFVVVTQLQIRDGDMRVSN